MKIDGKGLFDYQRMTVFQKALAAVVACKPIVASVRSSDPFLADQLHRSATSTTINIAEGSGEHSRRDKARFYRIARRSATESAAILDCLLALEPLDQRTVGAIHSLLQEVVRMLTTLARNFEAAPRPSPSPRPSPAKPTASPNT